MAIRICTVGQTQRARAARSFFRVSGSARGRYGMSGSVFWLTILRTRQCHKLRRVAGAGWTIREKSAPAGCRPVSDEASRRRIREITALSSGETLLEIGDRQKLIQAAGAGIASADWQGMGFGRWPTRFGYPKINGPIIRCCCLNPAFNCRGVGITMSPLDAGRARHSGC